MITPNESGPGPCTEFTSTRKGRRGNAHLIVADLKVEVLDFIAMRAAPVAAEECMRADQVERARHRAAAAILRHHQQHLFNRETVLKHFSQGCLIWWVRTEG